MVRGPDKCLSWRAKSSARNVLGMSEVPGIALDRHDRSLDSGRMHDFDFLFGSSNVANRRLAALLEYSTESATSMR